MSGGSDVLVVSTAASDGARSDREGRDGRSNAPHCHDYPDVVFRLGMRALEDVHREAAVAGA
jgi:hypothetical protein